MDREDIGDRRDVKRVNHQKFIKEINKQLKINMHSVDWGFKLGILSTVVPTFIASFVLII